MFYTMSIWLLVVLIRLASLYMGVQQFNRVWNNGLAFGMTGDIIPCGERCYQLGLISFSMKWFARVIGRLERQASGWLKEDLLSWKLNWNHYISNDNLQLYNGLPLYIATNNSKWHGRFLCGQSDSGKKNQKLPYCCWSSGFWMHGNRILESAGLGAGCCRDSWCHLEGTHLCVGFVWEETYCYVGLGNWRRWWCLHSMWQSWNAPHKWEKERKYLWSSWQAGRLIELQ